MLNRIQKRWRLEKKLIVLNFLKHFKKFNPEEQLLIFSDPRGGSTWLSEMLKTIPNTFLIWEPLNIRYVKIFNNLHFGWRQYIPEEIDWPEAHQALNQILTGKILNEWTLLRNSIKEYQEAQKLIIKFCRGNMMIPWLTRCFNFKFKPVYLVRHPFAVVNSQLKQGGWDREFTGLVIPDMPYNEVYNVHEKFLAKLSTKEEALTAHWCITNTVPLTHNKNNVNWITLFYEDLVLHPEAELKKIFKEWDFPTPEMISERYRIRSSTTIDPNEVNNPEYQLSKWKKDFSSEQIKKMKAVLEYFNIQHYNAEEVMPLINYR